MKKILLALPLLLLCVAIGRADTYVMDMSTDAVSVKTPSQSVAKTYYLDMASDTVSSSPVVASSVSVSPAPKKAGCSCSVCTCPDGQCPNCPVALKTKHAVTIPPGYHAHTKEDGTVIVHSDSNVGKAGPHEGIAHPWPKSGYAGQTVMVDDDNFIVAAPAFGDPCPNGRCPTGVSRTRTAATTTQGSGFTTTTTTSASTERVFSVRSGPVRRLFGVLFRGGRCRGCGG